MPVESLVTFFAASLLLALAPGPDNLFVLAQSALYGRKAGFVVVLGLCTGLVAHTSAVVLGVAALLQTSPLAFAALKITGATYLVYLASQALRASAVNPGATDSPPLSTMRLYRRGVIMNVTNPKVAIFFLAFLPQFADPAYGGVTAQIILLGALFIVATLIVFGAIAQMAATVGEWLHRSRRAHVLMNRVAALIFIGIALKLAFATRVGAPP